MRTMQVLNYDHSKVQDRVVRTEEVDRDKLLLHWGDDRYIELVGTHNGRFWHCSDHVCCVLHGGNIVITSLGCHPLYRQSIVVFETDKNIYEPWLYSYLCYDMHGHPIGTRIRIPGRLEGDDKDRDLIDVFVAFVDFEKTA